LGPALFLEKGQREMQDVSADYLRKHLGEVLDRSYYTGAEVRITRKGKALGVFVPIERYEKRREMLKKARFRILKGYRGLEIGLGDYLEIYSGMFRKRSVFAIELGLSILRKIGWGDFCFGGICYYVTK